MIKRTMDLCVPGSIILLHDSRGNRLQTVQALPTIIACLKARGYRFVTIAEMERYDRLRQASPMHRRSRHVVPRLARVRAYRV
jgi:peptidoglycan/xylan/chitin deacetylase (PgdA/CDA1 family)